MTTYALTSKGCGTVLRLRSSQSGWPICTVGDADSVSDPASAGTGHLGEFARFTWFHFATNPYATDRILANSTSHEHPSKQIYAPFLWVVQGRQIARSISEDAA
jgi:hypothetical protein